MVWMKSDSLPRSTRPPNGHVRAPQLRAVCRRCCATARRVWRAVQWRLERLPMSACAGAQAEPKRRPTAAREPRAQRRLRGAGWRRIARLGGCDRKGREPPTQHKAGNVIERKRASGQHAPTRNAHPRQACEHGARRANRACMTCDANARVRRHHGAWCPPADRATHKGSPDAASGWLARWMWHARGPHTAKRDALRKRGAVHPPKMCRNRPRDDGCFGALPPGHLLRNAHRRAARARAPGLSSAGLSSPATGMLGTGTCDQRGAPRTGG